MSEGWIGEKDRCELIEIITNLLYEASDDKLEIIMLVLDL